MSLRSQLEALLLARVLANGFQQLEARHVGRLVDLALDKRYGESQSEKMQAQLIAFLRSVIAELEEDHANPQ